MTTTTTEPKPADAAIADEAHEPNENPRETPAFRALVAQLNEARERLADVERQQAEREAKAAEEAARASGDFEEARRLAEERAAKAEARAAEIEAAHRTEVTRLRLEQALTEAGARNATFRAGAVSAYLGADEQERGEIADFVASLAADELNRPFFASSSPTSPGLSSRASTAAPSGDLKSRAQAGDAEAQREYLRKLLGQ